MSENLTRTQRLFRDLQRSGIKRLLLESPGRNLFGTTFLKKTSHAVCIHLPHYSHKISSCPSCFQRFPVFFSRSTRKPQQVHGENDDSRSTVVTMMISGWPTLAVCTQKRHLSLNVNLHIERGFMYYIEPFNDSWVLKGSSALEIEGLYLRSPRGQDWVPPR